MIRYDLFPTVFRNPHPVKSWPSGCNPQPQVVGQPRWKPERRVVRWQKESCAMAPLPPRVSSRSRLSREPSEAISPPPCCWLGGGSMMERERESRPCGSAAGPVGRERERACQLQALVFLEKAELVLFGPQKGGPSRHIWGNFLLIIWNIKLPR